MRQEFIKMLIGDLEQLAADIKMVETAPKTYYNRLTDLINAAKIEERGLMRGIDFDVFKFEHDTKCPIFRGRSFLLDESFQWSLEHTTKGELVLVPREKKKGTHGNADFYMEGGEHGN